MANAVVTVLEADGVTQTDVTILDVGRQAAAASKSVAASTEDKAVLDAMAASLAIIDNTVPPVLGTGSMSGSVPVTLATDDTQFAALLAFGKVDDAAFTPATSKVWPAAFLADETATDSVDEGDAGAARITLDRKQIITPYPHTAGGLLISRDIDLDEGTLTVVKNSPGQVYGMWVTNTATTTRFIKFYDATSGTAGTGTPVITIGIPGNSSDDISGSFGPGGMGIAFGTGICVGATTGVADADTGAPAANDVIVNIFYK